MHGQFFFPIGQLDDERIAGHMVIHEGSQPDAECAGKLYQRLERRVHIFFFDSLDELLSERGAIGQILDTQVLLFPVGSDSFSDGVHEKNLHSCGGGVDPV